MVSRLDSKGDNECKYDRYRQELSTCLLLNLFFVQDSYSNEYFAAKCGFETAETLRTMRYAIHPSENKSSKVCQKVVRQLARLSWDKDRSAKVGSPSARRNLRQEQPVRVYDGASRVMGYLEEVHRWRSLHAPLSFNSLALPAYEGRQGRQAEN